VAALSHRRPASGLNILGHLPCLGKRSFGDVRREVPNWYLTGLSNWGRTWSGGHCVYVGLQKRRS